MAEQTKTDYANKQEADKAAADKAAKETAAEKATVKGPVVKAVSIPVPFVNAIPAGAMDPKDVLPGYAPNQGSPVEGDPTRLANPNNPNSPVTVSLNPSNPANPPATQSDKPASEQRIYHDLLALNNPPTTQAASKAVEDRRKEAAALLTEIGAALNEFNGESNIPHSHPYWGLVAKHRLLANP
jgi:hypothetical protein